jgi:hypothetical protein
VSDRPLELRLELLRMRGQLERAEIAAAMAELRGDVQRIGRVASGARTLAATLGGRGGDWIDAVSAALGPAARWAPLALRLLRAARRHPWAAVALAAGAMALAGWSIGRARGIPPERTPEGAARGSGPARRG